MRTYNSVAVKHHNIKVINNDLNACFNLTNSVSYGLLMAYLEQIGQKKYGREEDIPTVSELKLVTAAMQGRAFLVLSCRLFQTATFCSEHMSKWGLPSLLLKL